MTLFRPLRACTAPKDLNRLRFPLVVSPKLDGIRCVIKDGVALTRTLTPVPNNFIRQSLTRDDFLEGLDGELIVGIPNAPDAWNKTQSGVMSVEGTPDFAFYVFDDFTLPDHPFYDEENGRLQALRERLHGEQREGYPVRPVPHVLVHTVDELKRWQKTWVSQGYEGVMLRDPGGVYKFGESTALEGILLKLKIWEDSEATIIGFIEQMKNTAEKTVDARGYVKRNKRKDSLVGKDTLGALVCEWNGLEIEVGGGLTQAMRGKIWRNRAAYLNKRCKFKYQGLTKEGHPRFAGYLGIRDARD